MTALGSGKIWILVPDWSRLKSSEPKAGDVTHKIGPLYFTCSPLPMYVNFIIANFPCGQFLYPERGQIQTFFNPPNIIEWPIFQDTMIAYNEALL